MVSGLVVRVLSRERVEFDLLNQVKARLFLDPDILDFDVLLKAEIKRAIEEVENFTGQAIGPQTRIARFSVLTEETDLPFSPFRELVSITSGGYVDSDGIMTAKWSTGGSITYKCGYDNDQLTPPAGLISAVVLAAAEFSGLRSDLTEGGWRKAARPYSRFTWAD